MKHLILIVLVFAVVACRAAETQLPQQGLVGDLNAVIVRWRPSLLRMQANERSQELELAANSYLVEFGMLEVDDAWPKVELLMIQFRKDCGRDYIKGKQLIDCLERSDSILGTIQEEID